MSEIDETDVVKKQLEREIIRAFGSAIIEFEAVLFQKVILTSVKMLITEAMFSARMWKMAEKGYISPLSFHGRECWKKLVDEDEMDEMGEKELAPEQVREIYEKSQSRLTGGGHVPSVSDTYLTEAKIIANDILELIRAKDEIPEKKDSPFVKSLLEHIREARRVLTRSEDEFEVYVRENFPSSAGKMQLVLKAKGVELMVHALRIIEGQLSD